MRVIPGEVVKQQAKIARCDQQMAAQAAYQMLCGDFDRLTGPEWAGPAFLSTAGEQSLLNRLLTEPHSALVGRLQLSLLRLGWCADRHPAPQPRLPHQFLPLLSPHPDRLLSAADVRRPFDQGRGDPALLRMGQQRTAGDLGGMGAAEGSPVLEFGTEFGPRKFGRPRRLSCRT